MADATEQLLIRIDATTEQLRRELKRADKATVGFRTKVDRELKKIDKAFLGLKRSIAGYVGAMFTIQGIGAFTRQVIDASNKMTDLRARIGLVTDSQEELNYVYDVYVRR